MFLDKRAAFGSLEEGDSSVFVFCILIIPVIMALSLLKDKVILKLGREIMMGNDPGADEDDHGKLALGGAEE